MIVDDGYEEWDAIQSMSYETLSDMDIDPNYDNDNYEKDLDNW